MEPAHPGSNPSSPTFRLHNWVGHLTFLSLSFLTYKMEIIMTRTLHIVRMKSANTKIKLLAQYQALSRRY